MSTDLASHLSKEINFEKEMGQKLMTQETLHPKKNFPWYVVGLGSIVGAVIGYKFWKLVVYWQRLLRQPFMFPAVVPFEVANHQTIEAKAHLIATSNLRAGIEKRQLANGLEKMIVCAGLRNFREPWARDFGFASFGLVELDELQVTKESLEAFLVNQKQSGQFPIKIHSTHILDRFLHSVFKREQPTQAPLKPRYISGHNTISLDGNALLVIAALNYANRAGNRDFIRTHWRALKRAITWLEEHALEADGLLHQAAFADWADSIARSGRVLYTNVLYWKALHDLALFANTLEQTEDQIKFAAKADQVKQSINDHFWRKDLGYFVTNHIFDNLSSSGNLLAIAWNLTTTEQAHRILDKMNEFEMASPVPTQVVHRAYPRKFIAIENRLGGLPDYHTSNAWLWLGAWHVIALTRMGRFDEAETVLFRISDLIVRDGAVHEVYTQNGRYLSTFWYTSEAPLTWSAGMVVYAYRVYLRRFRQVQAEQIYS